MVTSRVKWRIGGLLLGLLLAGGVAVLVWASVSFDCDGTGITTESPGIVAIGDTVLLSAYCDGSDGDGPLEWTDTWAFLDDTDEGQCDAHSIWKTGTAIQAGSHTISAACSDYRYWHSSGSVDKPGDAWQPADEYNNEIPSGSEFWGDAPLPYLQITTDGLPNGQVGHSYYQALSATGGTTPYDWGADTAPPPGLVVSQGALHGTPTAAGTYSFNIIVVDCSSPEMWDFKTVTITITE